MVGHIYQATVGRLLRILIEGVGGVQGVFPADPLSVNELVVRKAAGNCEPLKSAPEGIGSGLVVAVTDDVFVVS